MLKKNSLIITMLVLIVIVITFINYLSYKTYYNEKLVNLANVILIQNPNIDEVELVKLLKEENNSSENRLEKYGYTNKDIFFTKEIKEKIYINMVINSLVVLGISSVCICIKNNKNKKRNKEIQELILVTEKINKGNYDFDLNKYKESEFSKLYNTIFKITLLLKEYNEYLTKDHLILKDNIADISHQLKTPLTATTLLLESLLEDDNMPILKQKEFIKKIYDKNEKICSLIEILLKLSKIETSVIEFKKEEIKAIELLNNIKQDVKELANLNNISINIICDENIKMFCDSVWQEEALTNIVKNCIEFSKENGMVDIEVEDNNFYTLITIKDKGKGIKKEDINKIFERFHKSENSKGFGIGLNLAKTIIEKDGGIISVDSKINEYTKFTIKYMKELRHK